MLDITKMSATELKFMMKTSNEQSTQNNEIFYDFNIFHKESRHIEALENGEKVQKLTWVQSPHLF